MTAKDIAAARLRLKYESAALLVASMNLLHDCVEEQLRVMDVYAEARHAIASIINMEQQ